MKKRLFFIAFLLLLISIDANSQYVDLLNAADKGLASAKKKKIQKLATTHTTYFTAAGESVPMMRVPAEEIKSDASSYIILLQEDLKIANTSYLANQPIADVNKLNTNVSNITTKDADWVVENYQMEINFYSKYEAKRKKTADSIAAVTLKAQQIAKQKTADSLAKINKDKEIALKEQQKLKADSTANAERLKGYSFVNVDELSLREKPSTSGKLLATLGVCTYVKILNNTETDGYVYVKVGTMQGYVYKSYLVENLDDITVSDADVVTAKTKKIEIIETIVTNNGRKYMRDSKGNCYYMNGSKKVLVDRGYCD